MDFESDSLIHATMVTSKGHFLHVQIYFFTIIVIPIIEFSVTVNIQIILLGNFLSWPKRRNHYWVNDIWCNFLVEKGKELIYNITETE